MYIEEEVIELFKFSEWKLAGKKFKKIRNIQ